MIHAERNDAGNRSRDKTMQPQHDGLLVEGGRDLPGLLPVGAAIVYPFLLRLFHACVGAAGDSVSVLAAAVAVLALAAAFCVPCLGILVAYRSAPARPSMRRLAYLSVAVPTLYVFLGVVNYMADSAYPDELLWVAGWLGVAAWAWTARCRGNAAAAPEVARGRVAHGVVAAIVVVYLLFHIANHLFLVKGVDAHTVVMRWGETVYRSPFVELPLVLSLLFMCASGAWLAWRWSATETRHDFFRSFQLASGVYLLFYIVGHMDSVFIYARLFLGIHTDWQFAAGAPAGMIHDAWNIRLLPHYFLGVFFALTHPLTGLRGIAVAHGVRRELADRLWFSGAAISVVIAAAIIFALCLAP